MKSLIIHGGAWDIPDELVEAHKSGVSNALAIGWEMLQKGASAAETVEKVVCSLEDDGTFDAGRGSHLNADGIIELDASIMDGKTMRCGAVASVHHIKNPISLARKIMDESEHILLVGNGAENFALEHGIHLHSYRELVSPRELKKWKAFQAGDDFTTKDAFRSKSASDTVGAVAMDEKGHICVGTSTGGTFNKHPGRVGDSPLIGCGSYADNDIGGVSTTGWGEAMVTILMAHPVIELLEHHNGNINEAATKGIELLKRKVDGYGGVIVMNNKGEVGVAYNTPRMARGYRTEQMSEPFVTL